MRVVASASRVAAGALLGAFGLRRLVFMAAALTRADGDAVGYRPTSLALVMPARNEAATLASTLEHLAAAHAPAARM